MQGVFIVVIHARAKDLSRPRKTELQRARDIYRRVHARQHNRMDETGFKRLLQNMRTTNPHGA